MTVECDFDNVSIMVTARCMIAFKGPAGSGKSTLCRALGQALSWPVVDKDDIRDYLEDHQGGTAYDIMFRIAERQLLQGLSVICDSPLAYERSYAHASQIARDTGALLFIVECRCQDEVTLRERINRRKLLGLASHHTTDWAEHQRRHRDGCSAANYPIQHPRLAVDTCRSVEQLCEEVLEWLDLQTR